MIKEQEDVYVHNMRIEDIRTLESTTPGVQWRGWVTEKIKLDC